jgi:serpin B
MNEELNKAFEQISDDYIHEASCYEKKRFPWVKSIAALLAVIIAWSAIWAALDFPPNIIYPTEPSKPVLQTPTTPDPNEPVIGNELVQLSGLAAKPVYPETPTVQTNQMLDIYNDLNRFFRTSIQEFLSGEGNRAYSPLNVYMALAMLAQTSDGQSRQQILDLLGSDTIDKLQPQTTCVWDAHYLDDEYTKLLLANSLWLDNAHLFNPETVQTLADNYYASVYAGDLGSDEMNEALRQWIDEHTGNLLQEHSQELELDPNSVFALASTVYFKANWVEAFSEKNTTNGIFHSTRGDVTVPFMHSSRANAYYWGEDYTAVRLSLEWGNAMWLILPDDGKTTQDLLDSGEFLSAVLPTDAVENQSFPTVNLSMPKFDISAKADLITGIQNLGVTDIFSPRTADLSSLTDANAYVGKIEHAVRVAAGEDGVLGAAYTVIDAPGYGMPPEDEVDFVVDRPFLFMVTSRYGMPLFAGVVEQP